MFTASNIILLCWIIFLGYWIINWQSVKPTKETAWRQPSSRWTFVWIALVIILLLHKIFPAQSFRFLTVSYDQSLIQQVIGCVLTICGLIIAIVARKTLADNWSSNVELKKEHKLITTGVYKHVRHPIYTGIDLMGIGAIIVMPSILSTLFFIWMIVFLTFKMRKEEILLMKHFSKDYAAYKKKTKALIPFIY